MASAHKILSNNKNSRITQQLRETHGESTITSKKPSIVFTETNQEYSVEEDLNAVAASLIVNIGRESKNTFLHEICVHRRISLAQTTLVGATQIKNSVLPIELTSD